MNDLPQVTTEELEKVFVKPFIDSLKHEIDKQKNMLVRTEQAYQSYYERILRVDSKQSLNKLINETDWLKSSLYDILEQEFPERREIPFSEEFEPFVISSESYTRAQPKSIKREQKPERFAKQANDDLRFLILKPIKKLVYTTSVAPIKFANLFRSEKKATPYWSHTIPYQAICNYYFTKRFASLGLGFYEELQQLKCIALNLVIDIDININIEFQKYLEDESYNRETYLETIKGFSKRTKVTELNNTLNKKLEIWNNACSETLDEVLIEFNHCLDIVDTLELDSANFSNSNMEHQALELSAKYNRIFSGWKNTFFAQIDDFQVDIELYHIKYRSILQYYLLQESCSARLQKTIESKIESIESEFQKIADKIGTQNSIEELKTYLNLEKTRINRKLEKDLVPQAIEAVYNQNLPELLDRLEVKVKTQIEKMKEKRIIYSNSDYHSPIAKSQLSHFNPRELVEIDIFPKFSKLNSDLKSKVIKGFEEVQVNLRDLSGISEYNLEAALSSIEDKEQIENVKKICLEGLNRAISKTHDIKAALKKIDSTISESLKSSITDFNKQVISLTENENITQIRIKIAKAKAVEKTKAYKKQIIENVRGFVPIAIRFLRKEFAKTIQFIELGLKKVGLTEEDNKLTAELADYLNQTDKAIEKLPYVYKRLYQIKPLEEESFFEGRVQELSEIKTAYESWKKGNYSATCIHGEKGSGASSLVNLFQKDLQGVEVFRHKFIKGYNTEEDFVDFFNRIFEKKNLKSFNEIAEFVSSGKKKVIILEDVQHFYLKKIDGFASINLLFELISKTAEHAFWLIEITRYTYNYLEKTIGISRYFRYNIDLKQLKNEQIVSLILKRHRVSGYSLLFEQPNLTALEQRKHKTKSTEEKQSYFKENFFANLNQFAQSNISLALLYWLRSTKSVDGNTIIMSKVKSLDFTFLNTLSNDSIFTLHALLLHDSLSPYEHALVFHQSETSSRRTLMVLEDHGLLQSNDGRYSINRLLYRQVVNVLTNKNIIH